MYPSAQLLCNISSSPTLPITQQTTYCHHKLKEIECDKGAEDFIHLTFSKMPVWNACLEMNRFAEKNRYVQPLARTCSLANMWDHMQICNKTPRRRTQRHMGEQMETTVNSIANEHYNLKPQDRYRKGSSCYHFFTTKAKTRTVVIHMHYNQPNNM